MAEQINCVIVMPVYNEAACLETVIQSWLPMLESHQAKLLLINDGSTDQTAQLLSEFAAQYPRIEIRTQDNQGHGPAILNGYREALLGPTPFIFQTDSDGQFRARDFENLWQRRFDAPLILGERKNRADGRVRDAVSQVMRQILKLLFQIEVRDANIPFRLMQAAFLKQALHEIPPDVFAPNIFITLCAARRPNSLIQTPVSHLERKAGKSSLIPLKLLKVCLRSTAELIRFRLTSGSS